MSDFGGWFTVRRNNFRRSIHWIPSWCIMIVLIAASPIILAYGIGKGAVWAALDIVDIVKQCNKPIYRRD